MLVVALSLTAAPILDGPYPFTRQHVPSARQQVTRSTASTSSDRRLVHAPLFLHSSHGQFPRAVSSQCRWSPLSVAHQSIQLTPRILITSVLTSLPPRKKPALWGTSGLNAFQYPCPTSRPSTLTSTTWAICVVHKWTAQLNIFQ